MESFDSIPRILIVDDDPQRRAEFRQILSAAIERKCAFNEAEPGRPASPISGSESPDCVVLLCSNPVGDKPLEALRALQSENPEMEVPIIVVIDGAEHSATARALEHVATRVLFTENLGSAYPARVVEGALQQSLLRRQLDEVHEVVNAKNHQLSELHRSTHQWAEKMASSFRAPLTVIRQFAAIVRDGVSGEINEEQGKYLDIVIERIADMHATIDDLLNVSKLECGAVGVLRQDCTIEHIIDQIRTTLGRKAALTKGSLDYALDDNLPEVYCDAQKIGHVITTLVTNALRASAQGSQVRIWARHQEAAAEVVVGVTDTGPGIDPQIVRTITEQFQGGAARPTSELEGHGLGLTIAKELVRLNLGTIDVQSELGRGTTFSFTVPTADPSQLLVRYLDKIKPFRSDTLFVSLLAGEVDERIDPAVLNDVARFLQNRVRRSDLVFRTRPHTWLLVIPTNQRELQPLTERLAQAWEQVNRERVEGRLPAIRIETLGTWRLKDQKDRLVERFKMESRVPAGLTV